MTGYWSTLTNLSERESPLHVELGDDARYAMKGVESTSFWLDSGDILHMSDILFVSGLKKNLLSILALEDKGFKVAFVDGQVLVWPKDSNMDSAGVIGVREGGLYKLTSRPVQALVHDSINICMLWHRRFAHLHCKDLPSLRKMVTSLPEIQVEHDGVCRECALGKNTKGSFLSSDSGSKGVLDLVHSNVCGPMLVPSLGDYMYYVIFIDDFSRKTWIYFLKSKDEVFGSFQELKALVENQTGRHIRVLRTDNGGEFTSNDFNNFCRDTGIKMELIVPYNPQQNGVPERKNRSICEATKAIIHDQDLPMFLWVEASSTTVYVQNRSPHQILGDTTPKEAFIGVKP